MEHPIWEAPHFGISAITGVAAKSIRQRGYLLQGRQHGLSDDTFTGIAACEKTMRAQPARLAERADPDMGSGVQPFHLESFPHSHTI